MWTYLCALIPDDDRPYRDRKLEMLSLVSPELGRYYLARGFDWERGSGGLEACLMAENDEMLLAETIKAYEWLKATRQAAIIRELLPKAQDRWIKIKQADAQGKEFDYDDGLWEPYEKRWDAALSKFDFYKVIWKDIRQNPNRYTHTRAMTP